MPDINIEKRNCVGRITLCRPDALNAITHEMVLAIEEALINWLEEDDVQLVMIDAEGDRAFCAGGDISDMYKNSVQGNFDYAHQFMKDEYRLNALINNYPIPFIAIMDGITMGGGVGISAHGSDRIVTERSIVAMPECAIGLAPDVGGNYLFANTPGFLGEFLAMTGYRMNSGDAALAGFADIQVASNDLGALKTALIEEGDLAVIASFGGPPDLPSLREHLDAIDFHFSKDSALACVQSLETDGGEWSEKIASMIRKASPLAVACAFRLVRTSKELRSIEQVLKLEYRSSINAIKKGDMLEGIRAQIIDKDRSPKWSPATLEELDETQIDEMLGSLGSHELQLNS